MKTITVTIDTEGAATIETDGYKGKACSLDSVAIEQALGVTTQDIKKPAYSQETIGQQRVEN